MKRKARHKVLHKKTNTLANVLKFIDIFQWHGIHNIEKKIERTVEK